MDETSVTVRISDVDVGGVHLSVSSAGEQGNPVVVLLHGFPEIAYSWRHQIRSLAAAGYRVLAPDQRGYGWSEGPDGVDRYRIDELVGDVIGLLDAEGADDAVVIGHDWGALVAPWVALMRPDRVRAVGMLSVPYVPRGDRSIVDEIRATDPDGSFAYILAFQEPGIEDLFDADPLETLRRFHWAGCGDRPDDLVPGGDVPAGIAPFLEQGEFENYFRAFAKSGFANPINWYRNMHHNWETTRPWHGATLDLPTIFIAGARDFVVTEAAGPFSGVVDTLASSCTDLRGIHLLDGIGHWVQQEAPEQVTDLLLDFLEDIA